MKPPLWSEAELAYLLELAGDVPGPTLFRAYNAWAKAHGFPPRSQRALAVKAHKCGISLRPTGSWLTTGGIATCLALPPSTVESWIVRYPDLPRRRMGKRKVNFIERRQLRAWAQRHPHLLGGLERYRLTMLLEDEDLARDILERFPARPTGLETTALPVRCLDDGRQWPSIKAAAAELYITHSALWLGIKQRRPVAGLSFELLTSSLA